MIGTVKWFDKLKSYGFISPDNGDKDAFVHIAAVQAARLDTLTAGDRVEFNMEIGKNGRDQAANLRLIK